MATARRAPWFGILVGVAVVLAACGGGGSKHAATTAKPAAHTVRAAIPAVRVRPMFEKVDADHDGMISAAEKDAIVKADFARLDRNHDGSVTIDDVKASVVNAKVQRPVDKPLDHYLPFDYDHNGSVDFAEYQRHVEETFGSMDANHDGKYSWEEVRTFYRPRPSQGTVTTRTTKAGVLGGGGAALLLLPFVLGRRVRRAAAVLGTIALFVLGSAVPARASAIYNQTSTTYGVEFNCGIFCGTSWQVAGNDWDAYPDESGTYTINDGNIGCEDTTMDGQVGVTDHGYSELQTGGYTGLMWYDFDDSGNQETGSPVNIDVNWSNCSG